MFARYAAIVKNLRGVVVADPSSSEHLNRLQWLIGKFRYRNLGLPPSIVKEYRDMLLKYLNGNPFRELVYPLAELMIITEIYMEKLRLPIELAEALTLSSIYISPLLVVGEEYITKLTPLVVDKVLTCKPLNDSLWKLHLRIADYTILDMYEESIMEALNAIELLPSKQWIELDKILGKRKLRVEKDKKRYWRVACDQGKPLLLYIDPLMLMIGLAKKEIINPRSMKSEHAAALSIIPVVNLIIY